MTRQKAADPLPRVQRDTWSTYKNGEKREKDQTDITNTLITVTRALWKMFEGFCLLCLVILLAIVKYFNVYIHLNNLNVWLAFLSLIRTPEAQLKRNQFSDLR